MKHITELNVESVMKAILSAVDQKLQMEEAGLIGRNEIGGRLELDLVTIFDYKPLAYLKCQKCDAGIVIGPERNSNRSNIQDIRYSCVCDGSPPINDEWKPVECLWQQIKK